MRTLSSVALILLAAGCGTQGKDKKAKTSPTSPSSATPPGTGSAASSAAPLPDGVVAADAYAPFVLSPDGKSVAFYHGKSDSKYRVVAIDGSNPRDVTASGVQDPQFSPDGSRLIYLLDEPSRPLYAVATWEAQGGEKILQEAPAGARFQQLGFDARAEHVLMAVARTKDSAPQAWVASLPDLNVKRVNDSLPPGVDLSGVGFDASGSQLIIRTQVASTNLADIVMRRLPAAGGDLKTLVSAPNLTVVGGSSGPLWYLQQDSKGETSLWGVGADDVPKRMSGEGVSASAISQTPDGRRMIFSEIDKSVTPATAALFSVSIAGERSPLSQGIDIHEFSISAGGIALSADGDVFAYVVEGKTIVVVGLSGGTPKKLGTPGLSHVDRITLSADGSALLYQGRIKDDDLTTPTKVFRMAADGSNSIELVPEANEGIASAAFLPKGPGVLIAAVAGVTMPTSTDHLIHPSAVFEGHFPRVMYLSPAGKTSTVATYGLANLPAEVLPLPDGKSVLSYPLPDYTPTLSLIALPAD